MNEDVLKPLLAAPESSGIFLDFDGTLSEIVFRPGDARPVSGARDLLTALAARYRLVSVVSGRSARELLEWLGPDVEIWGTHGAERSIGGRVELAERAAPYAELMARVRQEAERRLRALDLEGTILEDKGVMLGLHFRAARDRDVAGRALDELAGELAAGYGLTRAGGRLAYELRPPIEFSKAQVVLQRAREAGLKSVAFAGDDRVDLPGFDALDRLATEGAIAVRIAVRSDEAPPELIERADVVVDGPSGMMRLLEKLL